MKTIRKLLLPLAIVATLVAVTLAFSLSVSAGGNCPLKGDPSPYGDVNGDGVVNILDLSYLAQYLAYYDEATGESTVRLGPKSLGHDFTCEIASETYLASPATCTEPARYYYSCECGEKGEETFSYGDALGHDYSVTGVVSPTCTERGYTTYVCTRCEKLHVVYTEALGHNHIATVTQPTCTELGYTTHTCTRCGNMYVDTYTPALGHSYSVSTTAPTCTEKGYTTHTCTRCENVYVDSYVDALGHNYISAVTMPTCTEQGYTMHNCSRCEDSYADSYVDALGHHYVDTVTAPTCTERGYTTHICSRCEYTYADSYMPALGHSYSASVTAPTCTEQGYTTHSCTHCGDSYVDDYTTALGHGYTEQVISDDYLVSPATCTESARYYYACVCGEAGDDIFSYGDALGHNYVDGICTRCGDKIHSKGLSYVSNGDGTCYVSGIGTCTDTDVVIPSVSPEGDTVTFIGSEAFRNCGSLTSVTIPDSVTIIGAYAFESCSGLTGITIPGTVTTIGESAFRNCNSLTRAVIPEGVTSIAGSLFRNCSALTSVTIPGTVTSIGNDAFRSCGLLTGITIPANVTSIGKDAFHGCNSLASITIPEGVTVLGNGMFAGCGALTSITIPNSVVTFGEGVFYNCGSLVSVIFNGTMAQWDNIVKGNDWNCNVSSDVVYYWTDGNSLIETYATKNFEGNTVGAKESGNAADLAISLTMQEDGNKFLRIPFIGATSVSNTSNWDKSLRLRHSAIPAGEVIEITADYRPHKSAAYGNTRYQVQVRSYSYKDADGVTRTAQWQSIFELCFYSEGVRFTSENSTNFTSVNDAGMLAYDQWYTITAQVDTLHKRIYIYVDGELCYTGEFLPDRSEFSIDENSIIIAKCNKWASGYAPADTDLVTGEYSYMDLDNVKVKSIGSYADALHNYADGVCSVCGAIGLVFTSNGDGTCYVSGVGTCGNAESITIPAISPAGDRVTRIGDFALQGCGSLTSVTIPDSVTSIGEYAFSNRSSLTSVTIGNSVTSIGSGAFQNCSSLTSITIPEGVTSIGRVAFASCSSLTSITIPDSVTSIGEYAFGGCSSLTSVTIPDSVTSIGEYAFSNCSSLTSVTIGNSVTSISGSVFYDCDALANITVAEGNPVYHSAGNCIIETASKALIAGCKASVIPTDGSVTRIALSAFDRRRTLTSIIIPDSVTSIGYNAFRSCNALTSVTIPSSVTMIDGQAFSYCRNLATINFDGTEEQWNAISKGSNWDNNTGSNTVNGTYTVDFAVKTCDTLGHAYVASVTAPTCTDQGYTTHTCTRCGDSYVDAYTDAIGHSYSASATAPTCTEQGRTTYTCSHCGHSYVMYESALGHNYEATVIAPTCTEHGHTTYTCARCGDSYIDNYTSALGHSYTEFVIAPTCTERGSTTYTCSRCGASYKTYTAAFGHNYTATVIPPTCTENGYTTHICTRCKDSYADNYIDALGHDYDNDVCTRCGNIIYSNSLSYISNGDGTCYVDGIGVCADTEIVIPTISPAGDVVTGIGAYAFKNCDSLTSVLIPDSVTSIGEGVFFGCSSLESVTIPFVGAKAETGTDENQYPFGYIFGSTEYVGGTNTTQYYYESSIHFYTSAVYCIPDSVKSVTVTGGSILYGAFYGCSELISITISEGITGIGSGAFYGCGSLTNIALSDSVTSIGDFVIYNCTSLERIVFDGTSEEWEAVSKGSDWNSGAGDYTVIFADNNCEILGHSYSTSVTAPTCTEQGYTTHTCTHCGDSYLDAQTAALGHNFVGGECSRCHAEDPNWEYSRGLSFSGSTVIGIGTCTDTDVKIPPVSPAGDQVTSIRNSAFYGCKKLTSVTIPDSVKIINYRAFYGCSSLVSVTIGNGVTNIGDEAFYGCYKLIEVVNHSSLGTVKGSSRYGYIACYASKVHSGESEIDRESCFFDQQGDYLFYTADGNHYLVDYVGIETDLTLPADYKGEQYQINRAAFYKCSSLTSITISEGVTSIGYDAFYGCNSLESITLPFVGATKDGTSNTHFGYIFGASRYSDNSSYVPASLKTVVITGGTSIGNSAFSGCSSLTSVTIGNSVTSIGNSAFSGCSSLTSITIPDSVTSIGNYAFSGCSSLTSITIPDSVMSIGNSAFSGCSSLTSITIPNSVTSIGDSAFSSCDSLTSITMPNSVMSVGKWAFDYCSSLKSVYISDLTAWCNISFGSSSANPLHNEADLYLNGEKVTDLVIPSDVTSIKSYAFYNCQSLASVTTPNSVTSIGDYAFYGCQSLVSVIFKGMKEQWDAISKGSRWNQYEVEDGDRYYIRTINFTVHCMNGDITY